MARIGEESECSRAHQLQRQEIVVKFVEKLEFGIQADVPFRKASSKRCKIAGQHSLQQLLQVCKPALNFACLPA
jgi:hypothetical protein